MEAAINVGIIGYGSAARTFHAPIIAALPQLRLKAVVERHGKQSQLDYPGVETLADSDALLQDPAIDLVVITTPNRSHFDLAQQALRANKHVVVEKPFTTTSQEADQLIALAQQQNKIISVNHNRRWDGDFLTVQRLLESQMLGRLVEYESHFVRFRNVPKPNAWREASGPGSGILFDLGSHLLDQTQALFGLPHWITADLSLQRDFAQTDDYFSLVLQYDRLKVTLKAGMLVREPCLRFMLHGTEGSFIKYGYDPQEAALKLGQRPTDTSWGQEPQANWGRLITQIGGLQIDGQIETLAGCYQNYYQNIADTINGRAALIVQPQQARNTIRMIELAQQSSQERRSVAL